MENITYTSSNKDIAEAIRGSYGKDVTKDCKLSYCGTIVFGQATSTEILDKNCKSPHYDWVKIGVDTYMAFLK